MIGTYDKYYRPPSSFIVAISMPKIILAILIIIAIGCSDARIRKMKHKTKSRYAKTLLQERDSIYKKLNESIHILESIITLNNCLPGYEFKLADTDETDSKYNVTCVKCLHNYYRTSGNSSCLRCPVGFYSQEGYAECLKAETNSSNLHSLCIAGYVSGNDKYAVYDNSCYKCNPKNKEYMSYSNNHDKCFKCPSGSVVNEKGNKCTNCYPGYYEKDNKCIECSAGTYTNKNGAVKCIPCNNEFALAYYSVGGYTCDNSIFYDITENIKNNIINMDILLKPLAYSANKGIATMYNNCRAFEVAIPFTILIFIAITI